MPIRILTRCQVNACVLVAAYGCGGRTSDNTAPAASLNVAGSTSVSPAGSVNTSGGSPGTAGMVGRIPGGGIMGITGIGGSINDGGSPVIHSISCPYVTTAAPCGGKVVGRWVVNSSNLSISGDMDLSLLGLGCNSVRASGCLQVGGTWTANADGSYVDGTTTTGSVIFTLPPECLSISSVPVTCSRVGLVFAAMGWSSTTCSDTEGLCVCRADTGQKGGIGVISASASGDGNYETSGNRLAIDDLTHYSYCVSGQNLTLTPSGTGTTGSVQLWMNGSTGGSMNNG